MAAGWIPRLRVLCITGARKALIQPQFFHCHEDAYGNALA
jgi:hypothetical protein